MPSPGNEAKQCAPHWRILGPLKRLGIDEFKFHDLRHAASSDLVSMVVPILEVAEILGHKTLQMTMRYSHLQPTGLKKAMDKLNSIYLYDK